MAIREIAAPIVDLSPDTLVESGGGVVCLGFVAQADGTAAVRWAEVLDPDNPAETIAIKAGQGYPGRIQEIVSCDVALHLYFGSEGVGPYPSGGGAGSSGGGGGGALAPGAVAPGTPAENFYLIQAGTGGPVLDEVDGSQRLGVVLIGGFTRANQGAGDRGQNWFVASSPDGVQVQQVAIADKQDTGNASLASIDGKIPADPATATKQDVGNITLASIVTALGSPLQAGGSVSVSNFPATQAVTGPLTDTQLRAAPVPVSVSALPGSPAQEHVTAASPHATRLTDGAAFYSAAKAGDNLGADLRVSSAAVSHTNPVPLIVARSTHRTPGSTLPAAATTHTLSASPGTLRRIEWRYTGAGTKYLVLCDQAGGTAAAANWTGWYASMSNGAGKSYFEFPEGIRCASGIVLGVSATEPQAGVAITLSSAANENFTVPFFSIQP